MSTTYSYLKCDDGLFYKDVIIRSEHNGRRWFLIFDSDDPPEVVMEGERCDFLAALASVGIRAKLISPVNRGHRHFGGKYPMSEFAFVEVLGKVPHTLMTTEGRDSWEGVLDAPGW